VNNKISFVSPLTRMSVFRDVYCLPPP